MPASEVPREKYISATDELASVPEEVEGEVPVRKENEHTVEELSEKTTPDEE